jgi:hypothetical protein
MHLATEWDPWGLPAILDAADAKCIVQQKEIQETCSKP